MRSTNSGTGAEHEYEHSAQDESLNSEASITSQHASKVAEQFIWCWRHMVIQFCSGHLITIFIFPQWHHHPIDLEGNCRNKPDFTGTWSHFPLEALTCVPALNTNQLLEIKAVAEMHSLLALNEIGVEIELKWLL